MIEVPLADILRPRKLDDVVGQEDLLAPGKPFRLLIESKKLRSFILYGPPGTGKTTLARVISEVIGKCFIALNATNASVKDLRGIGDRATKTEESMVVFIDEIHRFSTTQADVLLPMVENGTIIFIGATTANPFHSVSPPLVSRSQIFKLKSLSERDLAKVIVKGIEYFKAKGKKINIDLSALKHMIRMSCGDARKAVGIFDLAVSVSKEGKITLEDVKAVAPEKYIVFGKDDHFDLASSFQGSIQASDPNGAVFWLAKWLESGEDPRYIARRLLVSASEDAFSSPLCVSTALAAYTAACEIGRPECDILLSQATIMIATAPRDKRGAKAIWDAVNDVKNGVDVAVPDAMKDAHYSGAKTLGHGSFKDGMNQSCYVGINKTYFREV